MKTARLRLIAVAFVSCFAVVLWAACTVDFDGSEADVYFCETDEDCVDHHTCDETIERCIVDDSANGNGGNGEIDECDPDELGEDYPLDEPIDGVQERCDGQDNTCDGYVDVIFCEDSGDCPSSGEDVYGTTLEYDCEEPDADARERKGMEADDDRSVCMAYDSDRFSCPDPFPCDSEAGAHEPVYEHDNQECSDRGEPPPDGD